MTDKFDYRVGHLNTILARGSGNLNDPIFKKSNARALLGGWGGMLKLRVDRRINTKAIGFAIFLLFFKGQGESGTKQMEQDFSIISGKPAKEEYL